MWLGRLWTASSYSPKVRHNSDRTKKKHGTCDLLSKGLGEVKEERIPRKSTSRQCATSSVDKLKLSNPRIYLLWHFSFLLRALGNENDNGKEDWLIPLQTKHGKTSWDWSVVVSLLDWCQDLLWFFFFFYTAVSYNHHGELDNPSIYSINNSHSDHTIYRSLIHLYWE